VLAALQLPGVAALPPAMEEQLAFSAAHFLVVRPP
jgi:hypothetical protein